MSTIRGILNREDRPLIHDDLNNDVLLQILEELRKMNAHLESISGEKFIEGEFK